MQHVIILEKADLCSGRERKLPRKVTHTDFDYAYAGAVFAVIYTKNDYVSS